MKTSRSLLVLSCSILFPAFVACGDNGEVLGSKESPVDETPSESAGTQADPANDSMASGNSAQSGSDSMTDPSSGSDPEDANQDPSNVNPSTSDTPADAETPADTETPSDPAVVTDTAVPTDPDSMDPQVPPDAGEIPTPDPTDPTDAGTDSDPSPDAGNNASDSTGLEALCLSTGGAVDNVYCCMGTEAFPDLCLIGACGCSPTASDVTPICQCPANTCFTKEEGCVAGL